LGFSQLLSYVTPHRRTLVHIVLLLLAVAAVNLANPLLAGKLSSAILTQPGSNDLGLGPIVGLWLGLVEDPGLCTNLT